MAQKLVEMFSENGIENLFDEVVLDLAKEIWEQKKQGDEQTAAVSDFVTPKAQANYERVLSIPVTSGSFRSKTGVTKVLNSSHARSGNCPHLIPFNEINNLVISCPDKPTSKVLSTLAGYALQAMQSMLPGASLAILCKHEKTQQTLLEHLSGDYSANW